MNSPRFVFICAAGHSGSTLLDLLLGAHPDGISVGEITQLPKNIALDSVCSCGQHLSSCTFWTSLIDDYSDFTNQDIWHNPYALNLGIIRAGREIDTAHQTRSRMVMRKLAYGAEYGRLGWHIPVPDIFRQSIVQGVKNKSQLFHYLLKHENKQFVVDSSKHYIEATNLCAVAPAETRILWLLRDGRAVFNSGLGRGMSPKKALNAWARHCRRSSRIFQRRLPDSIWLTVRYESLATEPEQELRRISEFLEIDYSPKMTDFAATESHIANGNRMRFGRTSEIRLDEKWRRELSPDMLQFFERNAGSLNRTFGYRK